MVRTLRPSIAAVSVITATLLMAPTAITASARAVSASAASNADVPVAFDLEAAIDRLGNRSFPGLYGGTVALADGTGLAIYLTQVTPQAEAAFEAISPDSNLIFRTTPNSMRTIRGIHAGLRARWDTLIDQGVDVVEFGPDVKSGTEDIGVENLTASNSRQLATLFDSSAIDVHNVTPDQVESVKLLDLNRTHDVAPYNGGDAIANTTAGCSTGFGVRVGDRTRVLSAGHCFVSKIDGLKNARCDAPYPNPPCSDLEGSQRKMGSVTNRGISYDHDSGEWSGLDTELISGCDGTGVCGGSGQVFRGVIHSPYAFPVSGQLSWKDGDSVCQSGAYSGEICNLQVTQVNFCRTIYDNGTPFHYCHLSQAHRSSGLAGTFGDSGGPVYRIVNGGLYAVGTVTGGDFGNGDLYFTGIIAICNKWNASVLAG